MRKRIQGKDRHPVNMQMIRQWSRDLFKALGMLEICSRKFNLKLDEITGDSKKDRDYASRLYTGTRIPSIILSADGFLNDWVREIVGAQTVARRFRSKTFLKGLREESACRIALSHTHPTSAEPNIAMLCLFRDTDIIYL